MWRQVLGKYTVTSSRIRMTSSQTSDPSYRCQRLIVTDLLCRCIFLPCANQSVKSSQTFGRTCSRRGGGPHNSEVPLCGTGWATLWNRLNSVRSTSAITLSDRGRGRTSCRSSSALFFSVHSSLSSISLIMLFIVFIVHICGDDRSLSSLSSISVVMPAGPDHSSGPEYSR